MKQNIQKNIFYLLLMQGGNYLVPIILIPVIISRLSLEVYGIIALAQGIMVLFTSLADFGFNMTGTRLISQATDNRSTLINQIISIKTLNLIVGLICLLAITHLIPSWKAHTFLIVTSYAITIGHGYFPVWYFQGIQKMGFILVLNSLSRILYLILVIFFVTNPSDAWLVNVFNGFTLLLASFVAIQLIRQKEGKINLDFSAETWYQYRLNWKIFGSNLAGDVYRSSAMIIAGFVFTPVVLGTYGVFDKLITLIQNGFAAIYRALFPAISNAVQYDHESIKSTYRSYLRKFGILTVAGSISFVLLGDSVLALISDEFEGNHTIELIFISFVPIIYFLSVPISVNLVAFDKKNQYMKYNGTIALVFILISPFLAYQLSIVGLLLSHTIALSLALMLGFYYNKKQELILF